MSSNIPEQVSEFREVLNGIKTKYDRIEPEKIETRLNFIEKKIAGEIPGHSNAGYDNTNQAGTKNLKFFDKKSYGDKFANRGKTSLGNVIEYLGTGKDNGIGFKDALSSTSAGNFLAPEISADIVHQALANSVVANAGIQIYPYGTSSVRIPVVSGISAASMWKAENAAGADNAITFDAVLHTPSTIMAYAVCSREALEDSQLLQQTVVDALYRKLGNEIDRVVLRGLGSSNEPQGIRFNTGVNVKSVTTAVSPGMIAESVYRVRANNYVPSAVVLSERDLYTYLTTVSATDGQPITTLPYLSGLNVFGTNQVPSNISYGSPAVSNTSEIFAGDFSQVILGVRQDLQVEVSPFAGDAFVKNQLYIRVVGRFSVAVRDPKAFDVVAGTIART